MKNFIAIEDHTKEELDELIKLAIGFRQKRHQDVLKEKTLITVFFNPSTRTRISFDLAITELGGHHVGIEPGKTSWGIEVKEGAVMDGDAEEHLKEFVKVLCSYGDAIAVRAFPKFQDWDEEKKDLLLNNMVKWSSKPVINMETISHPCQALSMMMTIKDKLKSPEKKKFALTWVYHPKALNTAVANSAGMIASLFGMDVVIANPPGYDLDPYYLNRMKKNCEKNNASFSVVNDMESAMKGADIVYAKSWGALSQYGHFDKAKHDLNRHWIVDAKKMALTNSGFFSHCLPVRRNVKVTDEVIDSEKSLVYEEAANRLHVQKAVLFKLLGSKERQQVGK